MKKEIVSLRNAMKKHGIHMYLVPTGDEHQSEYVPEFYKFRDYLSGFTGSAGTLLVTEEECLLWTDGRYFIQAEKQLAGSGIELMRAGESKVPTVLEYIGSNTYEDTVLGVNEALISCSFGRELSALMKEKRGTLLDFDLVNEVWKSKRPAMEITRIQRLGLFFTGRRVQEKLEMVRQAMKETGAEVHVISSLDDIAWLYNLRGSDIPYNPVFYSYTVISEKEAYLFVKYRTIDEDLMALLQEENIQIREYEEFYPFLEKKITDKQILLDPDRCNYKIFDLLSEKNRIIEDINPTILMKSKKTTVESHNIADAHIKDGLIMVRFIYWLKKQMVAGERLTEYDAAEYLNQLRLSQKECKDLSFDTIAAYGENAAMCHYSPTEETAAMIKPEGFLLVDSGGQYEKGTTDITRTIAVGPLTKRQKEHYTYVLQGHIRLAMARFPKGVSGVNLDILARGPLWSHGLDYNHGTGHGVGYYLNVHEDTNSINWNTKRAGNRLPLEIGMLTSDEPGLYLEGEYGIRIENLLLVKKAEDFGMNGFLEFESVTKVPYERDAVLPELLSEEELVWYNDYHKQVYELYRKKLTEEERIWLEAVTEPLLKQEKECYNQKNTKELE